MTTTGILRGCGDTVTTMPCNTTVNISNIVFNWIFIWQLRMPAMGLLALVSLHVRLCAGSNDNGLGIS